MEAKTKSFPVTWIMDIPFSRLGFKETVEYLVNRINNRELTQVVTANPEIVMYANESASYKEVLQAADIVVADGIGVVYASRLRKEPVAERVAGYDLVLELMKEANDRGWSVYLLGAKEEINQLAFQNLKMNYPKAKLIGRHHGYFKDESAEELVIINEIKELKPDLIFCALGYPRQELWIHRYQKELQAPLMMGVGGSLDAISGKVKRAPMIWQRLNLEWFYRLITNPSRFGRMLVLPKFMIKEILHVIKKT